MKSSFGYTKFSANWKKVSEEEAERIYSSSVMIEQLLITEDKDEDFSNCKYWNEDSKCLSCSEKEIEYQGVCYAKMIGCLIQPG